MTRPDPQRLYHYTCSHGATGISRDRFVLPLEMLGANVEVMDPETRWLAGLSWFTDLAALPSRHVLGLTSYHLLCDRTEHRFEVAFHPSRVAWWPAFCAEGIREGRLPGSARELSFSPGAMPAHWYVARIPVPIEGP